MAYNVSEGKHWRTNLFQVLAEFRCFRLGPHLYQSHMKPIIDYINTKLVYQKAIVKNGAFANQE